MLSSSGKHLGKHPEMAVPKEFKGLVPPKKTRHTDEIAFISFLLGNSLDLRTLFLFGALGQLGLLQLLPYNIAITPTLLFAVYVAISTAIETAKGPNNKFLNDVITGRTSAQLPSRETGLFGYDPAAEPVLVFHFGVRFSHPLGLLAPGAKKTIDYFRQCNTSVTEKSDEYGMLGSSLWRSAERATETTLMVAYFFRDVEGLNRFAHDDIHRKAWDWLGNCGHKHIGFFHEAFCVPKKAYETIYVNMPPLLMGATSIKVDRSPTDNEDETWVRPIVSADVPPLRSQFGRMGRGFKEYNAAA